KEALEEAAERVGRVKLSEGSILTQGTLGDLQLPAKIGVDVIAIRRGERWIVKPEDDVLLRVGDVLIVRGSDDGMVVLKGLAAGAVQTLE
ncbi:TPA: potassium channel protein, partial [Candidatus Bathyarchaeota archaeon]|nr:potassium channel protein [Candidatus Bathyarchaeota archaeon]